MLYPAIVFILVAMVSGTYGFTSLDTQVMEPARLVFFASLVLAAVALLESRKSRKNLP